MPSLADQFLKAGIADKQQVKKVEKAKRRENAEHNAQAKQLGKKARRKLQQQQAAEKAAALHKIQQDKVRRDRELNQQKNAAAAAKALGAQILQLVNMNEIKREGELAYRFVDGDKTETIYVNNKLKRQLSKGQIAIVRLSDEAGTPYQLVSKLVAEKIKSRDASVVVSLHDLDENETGGDDPYADYEIPDDFDW